MQESRVIESGKKTNVFFAEKKIDRKKLNRFFLWNIIYSQKSKLWRNKELFFWKNAWHEPFHKYPQHVLFVIIWAVVFECKQVLKSKILFKSTRLRKVLYFLRSLVMSLYLSKNSLVQLGNWSYVWSLRCL